MDGIGFDVEDWSSLLDQIFDFPDEQIIVIKGIREIVHTDIGVCSFLIGKDASSFQHEEILSYGIHEVSSLIDDDMFIDILVYLKIDFLVLDMGIAMKKDIVILITLIRK